MDVRRKGWILEPLAELRDLGAVGAEWDRRVEAAADHRRDGGDADAGGNHGETEAAPDDPAREAAPREGGSNAFTRTPATGD